MNAHTNVLPAALRHLGQGDPDSAILLLGEPADADSPPRAASWHAVRGMAMLARGSWDDARSSLLEAVASGDATPTTTLNLALARAQLDERDTARRAIAVLEAVCPTWDEPPFRLAEMLRADGDGLGAIAAYERALAVAPGRPEALLRLATLHLTRGAAHAAESLLVRCCGVVPDNWEAWDALGLACTMLEDRISAKSAFRRAHILNSGNLAIALRLTAAAAALGHAAIELARFEAVSVADPLDVVALAARASLLTELDRESEALELLEAAVTIAPDHRAVAAFRAERLLRGSRYAEALEALRHVVAIDPDNRALRNNFAVALTRTHHYAEAVDVLDELAAIDGHRIDILCNRANALVCLGRQDEGVAAARHAVALAPPSGSNHHAAWRTLANAMAYCEAASGATLGPVLAMVSHSAPRPSRAAVASCPHRPGGRLRLGLLSATLKTHPVGWLTLAGFENLDPERFDIVCIAQREGADPMQRRFRALASEWHPLADAGKPDLAGQIRALDLDVLIDLGGYGDQGMLGLCAQRLAPVQIKWVGMQNHTTGMPEIDWFVTDRWETPPELAHHYTERLLVMPDGYVCYSPPIHAPPVAPLPACSPDLGVTFGCFNNLAKVTPLVIATWATILRAVEGSRLVLKTHQLADERTAAFVRDSFASHGIGGDRLDLRGGSRHHLLLAEYGDIDMVLDPFPYSGGLTTCEALWMGVPVLTCPGETFASRHSASHLHNIGLDDWVVPDLDSYVANAMRWAADLPRLAAVRAGLRERMRASPLCDAPRFGRNLGAALLRASRSGYES
jgi:predicted O-linked N-acetylglucosamine transferase (SPINDLY family)